MFWPFFTFIEILALLIIMYSMRAESVFTVDLFLGPGLLKTQSIQGFCSLPHLCSARQVITGNIMPLTCSLPLYSIGAKLHYVTDSYKTP